MIVNVTIGEKEYRTTLYSINRVGGEHYMVGGISSTREHTDHTSVDEPHATRLNHGSQKCNILLDFDGTCTIHHSGGVFEDRSGNPIDPMNRENKSTFVTNINEWLVEGHNVAIITRGIGERVAAYFTNSLGITPVLNTYAPGKVSIFAPNDKTFGANKESTFWEDMKTFYVAMFFCLSNSHDNKTIFVDDTMANVTKMNEVFPSITCIHVPRMGDYVFTFKTVNDWLGQMATPSVTLISSVDQQLDSGSKCDGRKCDGSKYDGRNPENYIPAGYSYFEYDDTEVPTQKLLNQVGFLLGTQIWQYTIEVKTTDEYSSGCIVFSGQFLAPNGEVDGIAENENVLATILRTNIDTIRDEINSSPHRFTETFIKDNDKLVDVLVGKAIIDLLSNLTVSTFGHNS
jgi:hypothetical protein